MKTYITDIKLNGIKNIKEEIHFAFHNKIRNKRFSFDKSNIKAVYGPNGAGKSAVIHAVQLYKNLIEDRNHLNDNTNKLYVSELINHYTNSFSFEITFIFYDSDSYDEETESFEIDTISKHSIQVCKNENKNLYISKERLEILKTPGDRKSKDLLVFEIENGIIKNTLLSDAIKSRTLNLLESRSLVEVFQNDIFTDKNVFEALENDFIYLSPLFFLSIRIQVLTEEADMHETYLYRKKYSVEEELVDLIKEKNKPQDVMPLSMHSVKVYKSDYTAFIENVDKCTKFIKLFKPSLKEIQIEKKESNDIFICERYFCYDTNGRVHIEFESNGIKKLVKMFDTLALLQDGYNIFIDEFDANINDVYLIKLLEFFSQYSNGQLMFTTHNLGPMEIIKNRKYSLDFISNDGKLSSWKKNGNYSPVKLYRNGMIENLPFNIESFDFLGIFGE